VRVVRWGPILLAGTCGGSCSGAPELLRRRSLLFSAESMGWVPSLGAGAGIDPLERGTGAGGKAGRREGGEEVEICGLKVTLRAGFVGGGVR